MAPKRRYKDAKYHYMGAYRLRIVALRIDWTAGQIASTLHWMYKYQATDAERQECERLYREANQNNLQITDDTEIPDRPKTARDPARTPEVAHAPAVPDGAGSGPADDAGQDIIDGPDAQPVNAAAVPPVDGGEQNNDHGPDRPSQEPTTTGTQTDKTLVLSYMPSLKEISVELPGLDSDEGRLKKARKRDLLEAGLCDPDKERDAKRWHGTHFLGQGATGSCAHWVKTDENNNISERLAVRDIGTMHQDKWVNPINWRDQLPREIAIFRRLHEQEGYNHSLHRYYGHRIDGHKRRYRVYNEVCDLGNLQSALQYYSRQWRRRHNQHRWLVAHPEIGNIRDNSHGVAPEEVDSDVYDTRVEVWGKYVQEKAEFPEDHKDTDFDDLTDIEEVAMEEISEELPEVIPEAFLWQVFDQLVDAALTMQRGAEPFIGNKQWKEIVHKDIHFGNIFVKPGKEGVYGTERVADPRKKKNGIAKFSKAEYPQVVLADLDTAFYDLQDDDEEYQDNPRHYMCSDANPDVAARYPPELFWRFQHRDDSDGHLTKLTSATDMWAIGQIMWNLAMNLPYYPEFEGPFFDHTSEHTGISDARRLNDGSPYSRHQLSSFLLTGHKPFEASHQYSSLLRSTIRACLRFLPEDRPKVGALKQVTAENRKKHMDLDKSSGDLWVKIDGTMEQFRVGSVYSPL